MFVWNIKFQDSEMDLRYSVLTHLQFCVYHFICDGIPGTEQIKR